jgi:hypothetical protein
MTTEWLYQESFINVINQQKQEYKYRNIESSCNVQHVLKKVRNQNKLIFLSKALLCKWLVYLEKNITFGATVNGGCLL